jgi:hypothetical protein
VLTNVPIDFWTRLPEPWKLPPLRVSEQQPAHEVNLPVLARRDILVVLAQMILEHSERFLLTQAAQAVDRTHHVRTAVRVSVNGWGLAQKSDGVCVECGARRAHEHQTAKRSTDHF